MKLVRDPLTLQGEFQPDPESKIGVEFFTRGWSYNFLGLIPTDRHLFGPSDPNERFYLFGADRLGRDMLSRIIAGTRISMSIGLVGVALTLVLGLILGGISGYYGGKIDFVIQRVIELVLSLPTHPDLARPQRGAAAGLVAADPLLRHHADPVAGRLDRAGARRARPLPRAAHRGLRHRRAARRRLGGADHLPPHAALDDQPHHRLGDARDPGDDPRRDGACPSSASACSRRPSPGACCCRRRRTSARSPRRPWLFAPAVLVLVAVLALNFLGDGLRDAADPYAQGEH